MFEALDAASVKPSDRVGIVGLGGLGHLAVLYARALGCDVVVFSGSEDKRTDAMALGAKEFYILPSENGGSLDVKDGVNVLLLCGSLPDFELYVLLDLSRQRQLMIVIV